MARFDTLAARYRARALAHPLTRANSTVIPMLAMRDVDIGLSVNK